ncbi:hypothetical protein BaRGS_00001547 [Batillaria attramentaria]|uniref:Uncharacterized protein n=1 Tax=Batillaria attramentaria TaxID=370345 RepID=A0ABD0M8C5_9CAEN
MYSVKRAQDDSLRSEPRTTRCVASPGRLSAKRAQDDSVQSEPGTTQCVASPRRLVNELELVNFVEKLL